MTFGFSLALRLFLFITIATPAHYHVGPAIFYIKKHHQNGDVENGFIKVDQKEAGFQMGKDEETEDLSPGQCGDLDRVSGAASLRATPHYWTIPRRAPHHWSK